MLSPSVSVIIPVYNCDKWIEHSCHSARVQTYTDIEIIVVDDGSTDRTGGLCDELARNDSRIKVIHKANGGVSSARNAGLKAATGRWICFLDADDTLLPDALQTMMDRTEDGVDVVFAGYRAIRAGVASELPEERFCTLSAGELAMELFRPTDFPYMGYPWGKLFRRAVIEKHGLSFDEAIAYNEDRLFVLEYLMHCTRGAYTSRAVYDYQVNGQGAMGAINGPGFWKFETDLDAFVRMCHVAAQGGGAQLHEAVLYGTYRSFLKNRRLNREYGGNDPERNRRLRSKLRMVLPATKHMSYIWNDRLCDFKSRIHALLFRRKR